MPSNYKPIQVRLRPDQLAELRALATRRDVSITSLVRDGIDLLILENDPLLDIIGMIDGGPSDLSENHDEYLARWFKEKSQGC